MFLNMGACAVFTKTDVIDYYQVFTTRGTQSLSLAAGTYRYLIISDGGKGGNGCKGVSLSLN